MRITCIDYCPEQYQILEVTDLQDFLAHHRPTWSKVRWINVAGTTHPWKFTYSQPLSTVGTYSYRFKTVRLADGKTIYYPASGYLQGPTVTASGNPPTILAGATSSRGCGCTRRATTSPWRRCSPRTRACTRRST